MDRRLRSRDQAIQVGGLAASLRTLLEGLSGKDQPFVKQVASDLVRAVKGLKLDVDEYGPTPKELAQVSNLKRSLERHLGDALKLRE